MPRLLIFVVMALLLLDSCNLFRSKSINRDEAVARVFDTYLSRDEISGLVPPGTTPTDSADITTAYINNWIRQQLLLKQALDNLSDDHKDFSKQIEQYRNSLVIYAYESELVKQKLDTVIPMSEIEKYYNDNQSNFWLRENIVLADYAVVPKNSPAIPRIKTLLQSRRDTDFEKLKELCSNSGGSCSVGNTTWKPLSELLRTVPVTVENPDEFLSKNKNFVVQDSLKTYIIAIQAFKSKESASPLSFEVPNIRAILLNKRKAEMLKTMEEDLFNDAVKRGKFEIFKK